MTRKLKRNSNITENKVTKVCCTLGFEADDDGQGLILTSLKTLKIFQFNRLVPRTKKKKKERKKMHLCYRYLNYLDKSQHKLRILKGMIKNVSGVK